MVERLRCEFRLVRYVPDPVRGEFANIGVWLREVREGGQAAIRFTRSWNRARCLHAGLDVEMLEGLEAELALQLSSQLSSEATAEVSKPVLAMLDDTLSNCVQLTAARGTLAESFAAEMESLLRMYVEPPRAKPERRPTTGRAAIAGSMRREFERTGVWDLMRKRIAAREYTRPGDPLKLDCGYRNGQVRLFHAVSLENEVELAKSLAFSAPALRAGVERVEERALELTAVVEPVNRVHDAELHGFGVRLMEEAGLRVLTVADLERVAETARRELRV